MRSRPYGGGNLLAYPPSSVVGPNLRPAQHREASDIASGGHLLRPVFWGVGAVAIAVGYGLSGQEGMSIALALLIALSAFLAPRTALWMSTGFMVSMFVFFRRTAPHGEGLPEEFIYWSAGLLIVTLGLVVALFSSRQVNWGLFKSRLRTSTSTAMVLMLSVCLVASLYGLWTGNSSSAVMRQLSGFLLWFTYYVLTVGFVRTEAEVDLLLRRLRWVIVGASALYLGKLVVLNWGGASWYREASHLAFVSGSAGALLWNEMLHARSTLRLLGYGAQSLCCAAAILFMGSRASLGSLVTVAATIPLLLVAMRKKRVGMLVATCFFFAAAIAWGPDLVDRLQQRSDLPGQMARRFLIAPEEDSSYIGRAEQWRVVLQTVKEKPILGAGMGSEFAFFAPGYRWQVRTTFVDHGWGYLLLKTGLMGVAALVFVLIVFFKSALKGLTGVRASRLAVNSISLLMVLLYELIGFLSGPTFFHFSGAALVGTVFGCIVVLAEARQAVSVSSNPGPGLGGVVTRAGSMKQ